MAGRPRKLPEIVEPNHTMRNHIIGSAVCFALAGSLYLVQTHQAGVIGDYTHSALLHSIGSHGLVLLPLALIAAGSAALMYRNESLPPQIPAGIGVTLLGYLTLLSVINPSNLWSGTLGNLLGQPLLVFTGSYIGGSIAGGIIMGGIALLPNGLSVIASIGTGFEYVLSQIASGFSSMFSSSESDDEEEEIEYEEVAEPEVVEKKESRPPEPETAVKRQAEKQPEKTNDNHETESQISDLRSIPLSSSYINPPLSLLSSGSGKANPGDIIANGNLIVQTLGNFGIVVTVEDTSTGPSITRYSLRPADGLKLSRILQLRNELSLALAAHPIRIEAPIPGKSLVGIEIPNKSIAMVGLRSLLEEPGFMAKPEPLTVALGRGVSGKAYFANIAKIPHLLIAGTTGSGKSVTAHNLILSLLYKNGPDAVRLMLVDPKRVELTLYNSIPHLLTPVIKDAKKAIIALRWAAKEMDRRYQVLESVGVRDIASYHSTIVAPAHEKAKKRGDTETDGLPERMPYIVILIDELADIMQTYPRELEAGIVRLAQMSRAVGIHLIISTQRPSVNVITGLIKANIPGRLALRVSSQIDSRTILDAPGAESLLGRGDMLFLGEGMNKPERIQAAFVSEEEIKNIVQRIVSDNRGFPPDMVEMGENITTEGSIVSESFDKAGDDDDSMYAEAKELVLQTKVASTSFIQRKLRVGYSRAARLMDLLEERGVIGASNGARPREILSNDTENVADYADDAQ
jgi:DNA segregation ATPase FtsK/SpoIIIE, S-DNA-T family